jgi:dTDP-4-dehydrorhamnose reductase
MTRILLIGKSGQVGGALHNLLASQFDVIACDRARCDLSQPSHLREAIGEAEPDIIINAGAYTAVDRAETDETACRAINATAPRIIAEEARRRGAFLIHYSTDYVFDGTKPGAYAEEDATNPLSVYGSSKLDGDRAVAAAGGVHSILRVSWVFNATGRNFARTILRLAAERDELTIVADQFGAPTSADLIARTSVTMIERYLANKQAFPSGLYNLAPRGRTSWHGYAQELVREAKAAGLKLRADESAIKPIATTDYPTPAVRPINSSLDTTKLRRTFGISLPEWQTDVRRLVNDVAMAPA